jgi:hypothetical protein
MLSFGFAVAARFDGTSFVPADPANETFYRELKPITERVDPEAVAASRLDRNALKDRGAEPAEAMTEARKWVRQIAKRDRPVLVGYPVVFDWMFLYYYFVRFASGGSPFGFSSCLDMKSIYVTKANTVVTRATKSQMPPFLLSPRAHTHNALDDAIEQADMFARLFEWQPRGR